MLVIRGSQAHSHFRIERLLAHLIYAAPQVTGLLAQFIHFVDVKETLTKKDERILNNLLQYGTPFEEEIGQEINKESILVVPRIGSVSPWSSKATDIAHHCGLEKVKRIERGILYYIESSERLTWGDLQSLGAILHDPMTERVLFNLEEANSIFENRTPLPLEIIPILTSGKRALIHYNETHGLSLSDEEIDYLYEGFKNLSQNPTDVELRMYRELNSEHCRHKIFNAEWQLGEELQKKSLFGMIKNTYQSNSRGVLSAYKDNAAIIEGGEGGRFFSDPKDNIYRFHAEQIPFVIKVETHNHPTAISPFAGAATGVGGEIRDEAATGRGAKPKAGLTGYCVSNLHIPGFIHPWEKYYGNPKRFALPLDIMVDAPIGGAQFGNEFGRPNLCGFFRTFELSTRNISEELSTKNNSDELSTKLNSENVDQNNLSRSKSESDLENAEQVWGYHKPVMIAGGLGNIRPTLLEKAPIQARMPIIVLGGPAMLIGLGGSSASSITAGTQAEILDFASVQRGNPEMQRRCQEVIDACAALGDENPIVSIHDVGAGGLANAIPEIVYEQKKGASIDITKIPSADTTLSPVEIWCNEAQERFVVIVAAEKLATFQAFAEREACPLAIIGEVLEEPILKVVNPSKNEYAVNLPLSLLFEKISKPPRELTLLTNEPKPFRLKDLDLYEACFRLLRLPTIADKSFLITIADRTVTGLVARDPMVGPWQVPVADCAVTARSFDSFQGEAFAMGERPPIALLDAAASARMAIGEAITNIAAASTGLLSEVRLSANWMAACGKLTEDTRLFQAVQAAGLELCPALGITIPVGKDSLSMQTVWEEDGEAQKKVTAPVTLVASAFAPVMDIRNTLTPVLVKDKNTRLMLIDLGQGKHRLGGSCLAQVYGQLGDTPPDVDDPNLLRGFFAAIQQLNLEKRILAYHDRSDGGLFVTLCEMAFASHLGLYIDISDLGENPFSILFNEELGAVIQVDAQDVELVLEHFQDHGIKHCYAMGVIDETQKVTIVYQEEAVFFSDRTTLQKAWSETSYHIQSLRDNPRLAKKQFETIEDETDPGLNVELTYDPAENSAAHYTTQSRPKVAILREQGVNGHTEMAFAFEQAFFTPVDVHMNDLQSKSIDLSEFKGLVVCGGFSYGDVLGAGSGWAKRILYNPYLKEQFETFFNRPDTFSLGVCNGCQMLSALKSLIPGTESWPDFVRNLSEQFEARWCMVEVERSPSLFLQGMEESRLMVPVAHGEGRVEFVNEEIQDYALKNHLVSLRFVDSRGRKTKVYPANPNGSPLGITGLTTPDGRVTILMPHPERAIRKVQYSWSPKEWGEAAPWQRFFQNARKWVG